MNVRKIADQILFAALKAVDPYNLIKEQVKRQGNIVYIAGNIEIDLSQYRRILVCGAGKGTAPMARAMEEVLGNDLESGTIIVKYGHLDTLNKINIFEAAHPVPDENTLVATEKLLQSLDTLNEKDCVFVLLTGGGSALLESLPKGITLQDLQKLSIALLECGATINEINCIRKHISLIKGGQLARKIHPARCITLALSDVIGDPLSVIASGPTSPDPTTFRDALTIIDKFKIKPKLSKALLNYLEQGSDGQHRETPKEDDVTFKSVQNLIIGNNRLALRTAEKKAQSFGYSTLVLSTMLEGEAREIARVIASIIKEIQSTQIPINKPACLLLGGEPTVQIKGTGKGGRNQELALALAISDIQEPFIFVSCGSDGTDGPTDAAGAVVDETTLKRAADLELRGREFLANNDAYNFFNPLGDLIKTGPTGTNVMDIIFALVP